MIILEFLKFFAVILLFFLIGFLIFKMLKVRYDKSSFYFLLFFTLCTGVIVGVTIFSIFQTAFQTINIVFLLIGAIFLIEYKYFQKSSLTTSFAALNSSFLTNALIKILSVSIIIFLWHYWGSSQEALVPDHVFYSRISVYINQTGQENEYHIANLLDKAFWGTSPYHYFELWLNAIVTTLLGGLSILNLTLITSSILVFIIYIGFIATWERFSQVNWISIVFCTLGLAISGFMFYKKVSFLADFEYVTYSFLFHYTIKFSVTCFFIVASVLFFLNHQTVLGLLILGALTIATFTAVPMVGSTLAIIIVMEWFRKKMLTPQEIKRLTTYSFCIFISIYVFYQLTSNTLLTRDSTNPRDILKILFELSNINALKTRVNIVGGAIVRLGILYLPFGLLIAWMLWKKKLPYLIKNLIYIILLLNFFGLMAWAVLYQATNSVQVFYLATKGINIIIFLILAYLFITSQKKQHKILAIILLFLNISIPIIQKINQYSVENTYNFHHHVKKYLSSKQPIGVFFKNKSEYSNNLQKYTHYNTLGKYLGLINNYSIPVGLNDAEIPIDSTNEINKQRDIKALNTSIFLAFIKQQKKQKQFQSVEQSQLDFIRKYQVQYAILSKKAQLPSLIQPLVVQEIKDETTGERFLILKTE